MDKIGKIIGAHGLKGDMILSHQLDAKTKFSEWDCLMIEINPNSFIPFFIERIESIHADECLVKLEEINTREEVKQVMNKNVFNSINYSVKLKKGNDLEALIGYDVYTNNSLVGTITSVMQISMNFMLEVKKDDKEWLLPAPEEFIVGIDSVKQRIDMNLPDGILDL